MRYEKREEMDVVVGAGEVKQVVFGVDYIRTCTESLVRQEALLFYVTARR